MSTPVVVVPAGGLPVTEALSPYGWPMIESPTGHGLPVTFSTGGIPVAGISAFIPGSPVNTVAPVISGTTTIGQVLSCTTGTWSPTATSYAYQWRRNGNSIGGATASTYTLVAADNAAAMTCRVVGTNAIGPSLGVVSNTLTLADARPVNSVAPVMTGTATVGQTLSCSTGTWSNTPSSYAYQWTRAGVDISGATSATYLLVSADNTTSVLCRVTASNAIGAAPTPVNSNAMVIGTAGTTTVTAPNGQWWKFSGSVTNGVYINGDPWVLDPGAGVSLIEVSTPTTGTGATTIHGGMINPTFNTYAENTIGNVVTAPIKQGYDGRLLPTTVYSYDSTMNAHLGLPRTLVAGDSLVSAVSNDNSWIAGANPVAFARMACVTVVGTTPFADSFRPNYFGTTKINKRFSDANMALLPNFSSSSPFDPKGSWTEGFHLDLASVKTGGLEDPNLTNEEVMHRNTARDLNYWICSMQSNGGLMKPYWNMEWYPRDWGNKAGQLSMYVMINPSDRDHLIKRMLQVAIDAHAVAIGFTSQQPWGGGAGFWAGPAWWIRLAGLLFNDTAMKNVMSIATGQVDYYSVARNKWGIRNRVYLTPNATAHAQYYRVPGEVYTAGFPLFGDMPNTDISGGLSAGSNNSARDPAGITDMDDYKIGLPVVAFPDILDVAYENWKVSGVEQIGPGAGTTASPYGVSPIGSYSRMSYAMVGDVLASIAMADQAFWGGAVVAYAKRHVHDAQMWSNFGVGFDYDDAYLTPARYHRDVYAHGGTGSQWMLTMWEEIVGDVVGPSPGVITPTVVSLSPTDNATGVAITDNLVVTFNTNIVFGTGNISLYKTDDTLVEAFDVATEVGTGPGQVSISGAALTINPTASLLNSNGYYVQIAATAIDSTTGGSFAGILDETTWSFTTAAGGAATTIFTMAMPLDNTGLETDSRRMFCAITGGAGATNQIRATFKGHSTSGTTIEFASIAISSGGTETATATPVELTSGGGGHGFTLTAGEEEASDWVTLGGFTSSNILMVTVDFAASGGNIAYTSSNANGCMYTTTENVNNYNQITGTWTSWQGGLGVCCIKIEVQ